MFLSFSYITIPLFRKALFHPTASRKFVAESQTFVFHLPFPPPRPKARPTAFCVAESRFPTTSTPDTRGFVTQAPCSCRGQGPLSRGATWKKHRPSSALCTFVAIPRVSKNYVPWMGRRAIVSSKDIWLVPRRAGLGLKHGRLLPAPRLRQGRLFLTRVSPPTPLDIGLRPLCAFVALAFLGEKHGTAGNAAKESEGGGAGGGGASGCQPLAPRWKRGMFATPLPYSERTIV